MTTIILLTVLKDTLVDFERNLAISSRSCPTLTVLPLLSTSLSVWWSSYSHNPVWWDIPRSSWPFYLLHPLSHSLSQLSALPTSQQSPSLSSVFCHLVSLVSLQLRISQKRIDGLKKLNKEDYGVDNTWQVMCTPYCCKRVNTFEKQYTQTLCWLHWCSSWVHLLVINSTQLIVKKCQWEKCQRNSVLNPSTQVCMYSGDLLITTWSSGSCPFCSWLFYFVILCFFDEALWLCHYLIPTPSGSFYSFWAWWVLKGEKWFCILNLSDKEVEKSYRFEVRLVSRTASVSWIPTWNASSFHFKNSS